MVATFEEGIRKLVLCRKCLKCGGVATVIYLNVAYFKIFLVSFFFFCSSLDVYKDEKKKKEPHTLLDQKTCTFCPKLIVDPCCAKLVSKDDKRAQIQRSLKAAWQK